MKAQDTSSFFFEEKSFALSLQSKIFPHQMIFFEMNVT